MYPYREPRLSCIDPWLNVQCGSAVQQGFSNLETAHSQRLQRTDLMTSALRCLLMKDETTQGEAVFVSIRLTNDRSARLGAMPLIELGARSG